MHGPMSPRGNRGFNVSVSLDQISELTRSADIVISSLMFVCFSLLTC